MKSQNNINQERSTSHEYDNTRSKKKARKRTHLKSIMPDTDGTEFTLICSVKDIPAVFREWYMQPKEWD